MTQVNIHFPSIDATCYGVTSIEVSIGTSFDIIVVSADLEGAEWYFNNDAVLGITANGVLAMNAGTSVLKFIKNDIILGSFPITVKPDQAASLGLKASEPILK